MNHGQGTSTEKRFEESHLADVLRLWNCQEQDWATESPVILRYEDSDALIWTTKTEPKYILGAFDTSNDRLSCPALRSRSFEEIPCLCWRSDARFNELLGTKGSFKAMTALVLGLS